MPKRTLRLWILIPLLSLAPAALWAARSAGAPEVADLGFGETVEVNVVNVDVFVTDRQGSPVPGLTKADFQLFEDGKPVAISNFQELRSNRREAAAPGAADAEPSVLPPPPPSPDNASYIAVYFDDGNIRPAHRARVLRQLRRFLAENVRPSDRVMIASHHLGLHVEVPFTSDREALARALDAVETRPALGGEIERARATALRTMLEIQKANAGFGQLCGPDVKSPVEGFAQMARAEALRALQGMTFLVNSLSGVPGRKSLLLVSDGIPLTPGEELNEAFIQMCGGGAVRSGANMGDVPAVDFRGQPDQVFTAPITPLDAQKYSIVNDLNVLAAHAGANRVSFYSLQASGASPMAASGAGIDLDEGLMRLPEIELIHTQNYQAVLSALASETGGRTIFNANEIGKDLGDLWSDLSTHYSLGFAPERKPDGRQHRIEVKVNRPGVRVRNLKGFRDKPLLERTVDRTLATLLYGLQDNPLEIQVAVDEALPVEKGAFAVPVRLRIPLFKLGILNQDSHFVGKLRLLVASQTADGTVTPVRQVEVPLRIPEGEVLHAMGKFYVYNLTLQLKPGEQKVAVTVRDEVTGAMSFLAQNLSVGPPAAAPAAVATAATAE